MNASNDPSLILFQSLASWQDLQDLIDNGEAEGLHLECKAPSSPKLNQDSQALLAKALSGFSNAAGGIIIWGMSTTKHSHSGLDVLTQLEPIGNCQQFARLVENKIPLLATPMVQGTQTKVIKEHSKDTRGVAITHIPQSHGDPVQSNKDHRYYFRTGDAFEPAPHEMIRRLFHAVESPDLRPLVKPELTKLSKKGHWIIPISIKNHSVAIGEHVYVSVKVLNASSCKSIETSILRDVSGINPGEKVFHSSPDFVIHRGMDMIVGTLYVRFKPRKRALRLEITVYANRMKAREVEISLQLLKTKRTVKQTREKLLY